jgi:hypothetical protein
MASKEYQEAMLEVMKKARDGFRFSELESEVQKAAARRQIDRGKLRAYRIPGDFVVTLP